MKRFVAVTIGILLFGLVSAHAADTDQPKEKAAPREFIAETMPQEFKDAIGDLAVQVIDSFEFSSEKDSNPDYGLMVYITNHGFVHVFFTLITEKNEAGELVIKGSAQAAFVLLDEDLAWYKSEQIKKMYQKAVEAYMATK